MVWQAMVLMGHQGPRVNRQKYYKAACLVCLSSLLSGCGEKDQSTAQPDSQQVFDVFLNVVSSDGCEAESNPEVSAQRACICVNQRCIF